MAIADKRENTSDQDPLSSSTLTLLNVARIEQGLKPIVKKQPTKLLDFGLTKNKKNKKNKENKENSPTVFTIYDQESENSDMNYNLYANRKTLGQGLMDVTLMMVNAAQLKYLLHEQSPKQFFYVLFSLIVFSITLQFIIGIMCLAISKMNIRDVKIQKKANRLNTAILVLTFFLLTTNAIIIGFDMHNSDKLGHYVFPEPEPEPEIELPSIA